MAGQAEEMGSEVTGLGVATAKGGVSYVSASLVRSLFIFLLLVILVRLLQPAYYGFYTIAISFYAIIEIIGYFGIGTALRKRLPESETDVQKAHVVNGAYLITSLMGVILAVIAFLLSNYIAVTYYNNTALTLLLEIASITVISDTLYNVGVSTLLGLGKNGHAAISNVSYAAVNLVVSPALVLLGFGVAGALIGNLVAFTFAMFLSLFYIIRAIGFRFHMPSKPMMKYLMQFSLPVFVSNAANIGATNFGVLFLGIFASAAMVGNYGAAFKLGSFVTVILSATTFVLLPAFSHAFSKENLSKRIGDIFNGSLYYSVLMLLPMVAYAVSVSTPLTALLFSSAYHSSGLYFAAIASGLVLGVIGLYSGTLMIGHGSVKRFMLYQLLVVAIELVSMAILVPRFNATGLLFAFYLIGPIASNIIYTKFLFDRFSFKIEIWPILRVLCASVVIAVLLYIMSVLLHQSKVLILLNGIVLVLLYPPLLALFGGAKRKNIEFVRKVGDRMHLIKPLVDRFCSYSEFFIKS